MSDIKTHKPEVDALERARGFWENNNKTIIYLGSLIVVLAAAWMIYKYMFQLPKEEKANDIVFVTQKYFADFTNATDSSKLLLAAKVLNGDGTNPGALKIINSY